MNLKIGIIGTNFISDNFAQAAGLVPGAVLQSVYSRKQETGDAFAGKHGIPEVYTDYGQFLDSGIDAVYVASPNAVHCRQSLQALDHHKHVLCEKVMAVNEEEVRSMIRCAEKNRVVLLEAMRPDFDPAYRMAEDLFPRIGKIRRAVFEFCQYSRRYDRFREGTVLNAFRPELGNAAIMDIGVYCIHELVRFFGMPRSIKAMSVKLSNGFEGSGTVLMDYGDMTAQAVYSKITASVTPSIIQGEEGSILIDGMNCAKQIELRLRTGCKDPLEGGDRQILPYTPPANNMIYEIMEFMKLIENKEIHHKYLQYSLDAIRVIDEARRQTGTCLERTVPV